MALEGAVGGDRRDEFDVIRHTPYRPVAADEGGEIQIGSITLQVVSGDITHERTDAIVNGTNKYLKNKGKGSTSD